MYRTVFDELFKLNEEMGRVFNTVGYAGVKRWPETNVYENKDEYILISKVPGMKKDEIHLSIKDNSLTIRGERKKASNEKARVHLDERFSGKFERNFLLNEKIDIDGIKAETANGLLMIKLPKSPESKPKRIEIK